VHLLQLLDLRGLRLVLLLVLATPVLLVVSPALVLGFVGLAWAVGGRRSELVPTQCLPVPGCFPILLSAFTSARCFFDDFVLGGAIEA
jgi:hypothetical protein